MSVKSLQTVNLLPFQNYMTGVLVMVHEKPSKAKGLVAVFTGNGKGKTTSSLGLAFRALGHGHKVCIIQFIKGSWKYGELDAAKYFPELLDFHEIGRASCRERV